jgi:CRP-like cAMP-binding protein
MSRLPLVSPLDRALFLKAQAYLEGISSNVLAALASYTEERFYAAGTLIRAEGEKLDRLIFLGEGGVEVFGMRGLDGPSRLIEAPGAIGLAHHFSGSMHAPVLRAATDALCLELRVDDLDQILEDHFSLLLQMSRTSCYQAVFGIQNLKAKRPPLAAFEQAAVGQTPIQLDPVARLARLKQVPFWSEANLGVLAELIRGEPPQTLAAGEVLWREGDPTDRMLVILDGSVRSRGQFGEVEALAGATLGASELFVDHPRFETWEAEIPSRVIPIRRDLFIDLLEDHFEFAQTYLARVNSCILASWEIMEAEAAKNRAPSPEGTA